MKLRISGSQKSVEYMLLDAARLDGLIYQAQDLNSEHRCLYEGDSKVLLGDVAPWLFHIVRHSTFTEWLAEKGEGDSWGILVITTVDEEKLYRHLRRFMLVDKEDGTELYFRFYDPRVLRVFLPACNTEELIEFFGPIKAFVMENEEGLMMRFSLEGSKLKITELDCSLGTFLISDKYFDNNTPEAEKPKAPRTEKKKPPTWVFRPR